ncbi:expressed protein [Phakopsora pachyrhizi]|uniref:Expressed protein n=1 Tax=Phakopsora pachyrhizi TaxID=170000 RepID=A0AAV0BCL7_PHAPC|nr:expressed protein [Phakopsora pachyrhizi]
MGMFEFRLGGPMNYLTLWGLQFSIGTFLLKVLCSIFSNSPVLIDLEKVYRLLALAIEGVVLLAYWPLAIINPEMVVPPDVVITLSDDLLLHCYPGLLIYLHQIFLSKRLIDNSGLLKLQTLNSRKVHSNVFVILFGMFYTCWIEYSSTRFNPKVFPYPFLDIIFLGRYTIYISFLFIGLFLLRLPQPSS